MSGKGIYFKELPHKIMEAEASPHPQPQAGRPGEPCPGSALGRQNALLLSLVLFGPSSNMMAHPIRRTSALEGRLTRCLGTCDPAGLTQKTNPQTPSLPTTPFLPLPASPCRPWVAISLHPTYGFIHYAHFIQMMSSGFCLASVALFPGPRVAAWSSALVWLCAGLYAGCPSLHTGCHPAMCVHCNLVSIWASLPFGCCEEGCRSCRYMYLLESLFSDIRYRVPELLGPVVVILFNFWGTPQLFSTVTVALYLPISKVQGF